MTKNVDNDTIILLYNKYRSIWKVGELLNLNGQTVLNRLNMSGVFCNGNGYKYLEDEKQIIIDYYKKTPDEEFSRDSLLRLLPHKRTLKSLEYMVSKLNIGNRNRATPSNRRNRLSDIRKRDGHSKNFTFQGRVHSEKSRKKMSVSIQSVWKDPKSIYNDDKFRKGLSERAKTNGRNTMFKNPYSRAKQGYYEIPGYGPIFFRSKWEANYALYLCFLKKIDEIKLWEYEPEKFEFPVRSGTVFYYPDFRVTFIDNRIEWHEVKGWMDPKSKTKIKRFRKYYPEETLIIIGEKEYKVLKKRSSLYGFYK